MTTSPLVPQPFLADPLSADLWYVCVFVVYFSFGPISFSHFQNPAEIFSHQGRDLAETLNAALPSGHLYGDSDDPDGGKIYGDSNTAWNYLQLDPSAE